MKSLILISFALFAISCSGKPETASATENNSSDKDSSKTACEICMIGTMLTDLEKKQIIFGIRKDECHTKLLAKVISTKDSLEVVVKNLRARYNMDFETANAICARMYPADKIKDEATLDLLFYKLNLWDDYARMEFIEWIGPVIPETCETVVIEGEKYGIKMRGEILWLSEAEYTAYISKYHSTKKKIGDRVLQLKKDLVTQLTGIKNPDEYCMEMMLRKSDFHTNRYLQKNKGIYGRPDDPELIKLLDVINTLK